MLGKIGTRSEVSTASALKFPAWRCGTRLPTPRNATCTVFVSSAVATSPPLLYGIGRKFEPVCWLKLSTNMVAPVVGEPKFKPPGVDFDREMRSAKVSTFSEGVTRIAEAMKYPFVIGAKSL